MIAKKISRLLFVSAILLSMAGLPSPAKADGGYTFPFAVGTSMKYNNNGVHVGGYSSYVGPGWMAVDWVSDGDTGAGHSANMIYAMASGNVQWICRDGTSQAMRIGDLIYAHLQINDLQAGAHFNQGDPLGPLVEGVFNDSCGWSDYAGTFHVHLAFPAANSFSIGDWTLDTNTQIWTHGSDHFPPGSWITADVGTSPGGGGQIGGTDSQPTVWTYLLGGLTWIIQTLIMPLFGDANNQLAALNFGSLIGQNTMVVFQLVWMAFSTFNLTWFILYFSIALAMALLKIKIGGIALIARLIKFVG